MPTISRRDLELLFVGLEPASEKLSGGFGGITRFQKFLFLLEEEENIRANNNDGFEFTAYKAGPYSPKLYDDLEFLENLGLVESQATAEATEEEAAEVAKLNFDDLMAESSEDIGTQDYDGPRAADAYTERRYRLTQSGIQRVEKLLADGNYKPVIDAIRRIKSKYGKHSLLDLLHYVYSKYPAMTTESEIKDKVMRRRLRR